MDHAETLLPIRDPFGFLEHQTGHKLDRNNLRFWFHTAQDEHYSLRALEDDHSEIGGCPKTFGMKFGRVVFELAPVPKSKGLYFLAGVFRVRAVGAQHPEWANCAHIYYDELEEYQPFKFKLYIGFDNVPNFNNYVRKSNILDVAGARVMVGPSLHVPPPADPLNNVDLSWRRLRLIATNPSLAAWRTVLGTYNGIYVIRDTLTGDLYVGATFESIFDCWNRDYVQRMGADKKRLAELGADYVRANMRWSWDRIFPLTTPSSAIHEAETKTKLKLGTRTFGLNEN